MLRMLPRPGDNRNMAVAQLLGLATGAALMLGLIAYVLIERGFFAN